MTSQGYAESLCATCMAAPAFSYMLKFVMSAIFFTSAMMYILAAITAREMSVLVPMIHDFMNCETLADILIIGNITTESLMDEFHIDEKTIEKWLIEGISEFEKYALTFLFSSSTSQM